LALAIAARDGSGTTIPSGPGITAPSTQNVGSTLIDESVVVHNITLAVSASKHDAVSSTSLGTQFYWYRVASVNDIGESAASYVSTGAVSPDNTVVVKLLIPHAANARAYRIYRCTTYQDTSVPALNAATWQFVGYVADTGADWHEFTDSNGAAADYTNFRPGTNIAPLLCRNSADLCIAQMSPLLKMPLAPTSTTFEYLLLLYHTLVLKAPERQFIFKNVGKLN